MSVSVKNILVFGISHNELSTEDREIFIRTKPKDIINSLWEEGKIKGFVNLSTCLRIEFYLELEDGFTKTELLSNFASQKGIVFKEGETAVRYLFEVTCGFYSVIKGEDQILAQIKKAHVLALEEKTSTKALNTIFNKAIDLGKKFRTKSKICHNALSLEAISLKFIKESMGFLEGKNVMILGVGDLAQSMLNLLVKEDLNQITVANRSAHKALALKETYDVNVVPFEDKFTNIPEQDVVISITSAPHLIVKENDISNLLDKHRFYTFVDLAMPRDIETSIGKLDRVNLFTLDDIWKVYNENLANREHLLKDYSYLVDKQMENLRKWFSYYEKL